MELLFQPLLNEIKYPDKASIIIILKILLRNFKTHSHLSKYADEILQFLICSKNL